MFASSRSCSVTGASQAKSVFSVNTSINPPLRTQSPQCRHRGCSESLAATRSSTFQCAESLRHSRDLRSFVSIATDQRTDLDLVGRAAYFVESRECDLRARVCKASRQATDPPSGRVGSMGEASRTQGVRRHACRPRVCHRVRQRAGADRHEKDESSRDCRILSGRKWASHEWSRPGAYPGHLEAIKQTDIDQSG